MKSEEVQTNLALKDSEKILTKDSRTMVLESLLLYNRLKYDNFYSGYFVNHTVSALVALKNIGGTEDHLKRFFSKYSQRLWETRPRSHSKINSKNWLEKRGQQQYFMDYFEFFSFEISNLGVIETVNHYFPFIMESFGAEAFHTIIALGYGLESEEIGSIVEGLAFSFSHFYSQGKINLSKVTKTEKNYLELIQEIRDFKFPELKDSFRERMKDVVIAEFPFDIHPNENTLDELKYLTVYVFTFTGANDFFLLHTCTGLKALSSVLKFIKDDDLNILAIAYYWRAFVYGHVAQFKKEIIEKKFEVNDSWEIIIERTKQSEEEHIIKLVQFCKENKENLGDENLLFQYCAQETSKLRSFLH